MNSIAELSAVKDQPLSAEQTEKLFDKSHFCWIALDRGESWQTVDGAHLVTADAAKVGERMPTAPCTKP